jgi:hypothetical protein
MSTVSKEMLERMRSALAFDPEYSPGGAMPNHISVKRDALEALIDSAANLLALKKWTTDRIAECREVVFSEREPSIVVNHLVERVEIDRHKYALIELRVLNFSLRILNGETPAFGCRECSRDDACYDGSVACQKQATK